MVEAFAIAFTAKDAAPAIAAPPGITPTPVSTATTPAAAKTTEEAIAVFFPICKPLVSPFIKAATPVTEQSFEFSSGFAQTISLSFLKLSLT